MAIAIENWHRMSLAQKACHVSCVAHDLGQEAQTPQEEKAAAAIEALADIVEALADIVEDLVDEVRAAKEPREVSVTIDCTEKCEAMPTCTVCRLRKKPIGRSAPLETANGYCDHECPGYKQGEQPGHLWPGEISRSRSDD